MIAFVAALLFAVVTNDDLAQIHAMLDTQVAAWNRGDIVAYMNGYARSDDTTFVSGDTVTHGWKTVLERYRAKYGTTVKSMGTLAFSDLALRPLGPDDVLATGAWAVNQRGEMPHGRFTLIVHRTPAGWRIVYDHSS